MWVTTSRRGLLRLFLLLRRLLLRHLRRDSPSQMKSHTPSRCRPEGSLNARHPKTNEGAMRKYSSINGSNWDLSVFPALFNFVKVSHLRCHYVDYNRAWCANDWVFNQIRMSMINSTVVQKYPPACCSSFFCDGRFTIEIQFNVLLRTGNKSKSAERSIFAGKRPRLTGQ